MGFWNIFSLSFIFKKILLRTVRLFLQVNHISHRMHHLEWWGSFIYSYFYAVFCLVGCEVLGESMLCLFLVREGLEDLSFVIRIQTLWNPDWLVLLRWCYRCSFLLEKSSVGLLHSPFRLFPFGDPPYHLPMPPCWNLSVSIGKNKARPEPK